MRKSPRRPTSWGSATAGGLYSAGGSAGWTDWSFCGSLAPLGGLSRLAGSAVHPEVIVRAPSVGLLYRGATARLVRVLALGLDDGRRREGVAARRDAVHRPPAGPAPGGRRPPGRRVPPGAGPLP